MASNAKSPSPGGKTPSPLPGTIGVRQTYKVNGKLPSADTAKSTAPGKSTSKTY